jgi:hypothetical protein
MKRQRGRGRKSNGQQHHNHHRNFESNGPDVKIRGSASHVYEKYQQLARDAASAGDRIAAESYLQHAEHYFRLLRMQQQHQQRDRVEDGSGGGQRDFGGGYSGPGRDEFDDAPGGPEGAQPAPAAPVQPAPERQPHQQPQSQASSPLDVVDPEAVEAASAEEGGGRDEVRSRRQRRRRRYEGGPPSQASDLAAEPVEPGAAAFDRASNS